MNYYDLTDACRYVPGLLEKFDKVVLFEHPITGKVRIAEVWGEKDGARSQPFEFQISMDSTEDDVVKAIYAAVKKLDEANQ